MISKLNQRMPFFLLSLSGVASIGMIVCSGEDVIPVLHGSWIEQLLLDLGYKNSIIFNLCTGYLISVFIWFLVEYLPDRNMRHILKSNFLLRYKDFKLSVIQLMLDSAHGDLSLPDAEQLLEPKEFRQYFDINGRRRWDAFINHLQENPDRVNDLIIHLRLFSNEVSYLVNSVRFQNPKVHAFYKNVNEHLQRLHQVKECPGKGYPDDMAEKLANFLWKINSNWDIDGYCENDPVASMTKEI
jgi:hypothetical protein